MSEEIKINKNNKSITFINNEIAFSQFGIADEILDLITNLQSQLQQKENIIKEVREYVQYQLENLDFEKDTKAKMLGAMVLVMLDKENK